MLLTLAVIVGMGFLPHVMGAVEERRFYGEPRYAEITPVELKMDHSMLGQLLVLSSGYNSHEISPEQAVLSYEELEQFVVEGMKPYLNSGVLPFSFEFTLERELARPCLVYDSSGSTVDGSVFWIVAMDAVGGGSVELVVDDSTGKILMLSCHAKNYLGLLPCSPEDALGLYMNIYLDSLDTDDLDRELMDHTKNGTLHHTAVILRHPDLSGYILISFIADEWGLNMQIQSETYDNAATK